jgi:hypothetical protein
MIDQWLYNEHLMVTLFVIICEDVDEVHPVTQQPIRKTQSVMNIKRIADTRTCSVDMVPKFNLCVLRVNVDVNMQAVAQLPGCCPNMSAILHL